MRITTALSAFLPGLLAAQTPYFTAMDQGPEWGAPVLLDVSVGADGDLSLLERGWPDPELGGPYGVVVSGYSLADGVLWRKRFDPVESSMNPGPVRITRLANGQSVVLGVVPGAGLEDFFLMRLDVNGDLIGTSTFHLEDPGEDFYNGRSYLHGLADGSIVFTMGLAKEPVFVRWSGGSAVDWARSYLPAAQEPVEACPAYDFAVLPDGGLLLSLRATSSTSTMYLVRIGDDGEVQWSRNYTGVHVKDCNAKGLPNGDIAIVGRLNAFDPLVARLDAQGDILWATQLSAQNVDYGNSTGFDRVMQRANGDLLVSVSSNSTTAPMNSGLIRLSSDGQPLEAWSLRQEYAGRMGLVVQSGDEVLVAGQATMTIDGAPHRVIPIARFDPLTAEYCLFEADAITSEHLTVSNASDEGHAARDRSVSLGTMEWSMADLAASDLATCAITLGSPEGAARPAELRILPSIVERGGEVRIVLPQGQGPFAVEVLDMAGRVVQRSSMPGGLDRLALALAVDAGTYAVQVEDAARKRIGSGRVVVR